MINIDVEKGTISDESNTSINLYSKEGYKLISDIWLKVGYDQKNLYSYSWLGRPIIQIPEDMIRMQEVIYQVQPDVIVETGVAHGGSLVYYASILNAIGKGRVVGIDIDIRKHNRKSIEQHNMYKLITLIEGSSIDISTVNQVYSEIEGENNILVILDSAHSYEHVKKELECYAPMVSNKSYIVVTDGSMETMDITPRAKKDYPDSVNSWKSNNPKKAAEDFVASNTAFNIIEPEFPFNEGNIDFRVTHWPSAFIKYTKQQ